MKANASFGYLRENYSSLEDFEHYDSIYGLAARLEFEDAAAAWAANPLITWSVNPQDFRKLTHDETIEIHSQIMAANDFSDAEFDQLSEKEKMFLFKQTFDPCVS